VKFKIGDKITWKASANNTIYTIQKIEQHFGGLYFYVVSWNGFEKKFEGGLINTEFSDDYKLVGTNTTDVDEEML